MCVCVLFVLTPSADWDPIGTKKNCGQGGCGVCMVVISYVDGSSTNKTVHVNSCLRPLISCNGAAVTTVEGIGSTEAGLNPIQERLAANNGSQCGFCTAGMVCSMYGLMANNPQATQAQIVENLDGNLCRCTGYRPIVAAFASLGSDYVGVPKHTGGKCCGAVRATIPDIEELGITTGPAYRHNEWAKPVVLPKNVPKALRIEGRENTWVDCTSLQQLFSVLQSAPPSYSLVVGQTSSGIYPMPVPKLYINILNVPELYGFVNTVGGIVVGANETLATLHDFFISNVALAPKLGLMATFMKRIASSSIRNVGCWAGNLALANQKVLT
jgi:xanthine dehydrogenase/oxidase